MLTNLERYTKDLGSLLSKGADLELAMQKECFPEQIERVLSDEKLNEKARERLKNLPDFKESYQSWYSEAMAVVKQILPDRFTDFVQYYEKPKARKNITSERSDRRLPSRAANYSWLGKRKGCGSRCSNSAILPAVRDIKISQSTV